MDDRLVSLVDDAVRLEQRAIKDRSFILSTFSTFIKAKLLINFLEVRLKLRINSFTEHLGIKTHAAYLGELDLHVTLHHLVKQGMLLLLPKICETH